MITCNIIYFIHKGIWVIIQDLACKTKCVVCVVQFFFCYITHVYFSAFCLCCNGCQHTNGSCSYYQNLVTFLDICTRCAMIADAERLDQCKLFWCQSLAFVDTFDWHGNVFRKCSVSLCSHCFIGLTAVYQTSLAWIAVSTVKIRITGYYHSRLQPSVVFIYLNNLC